MPQIVHLGARTGFVQELQMSQRQTWLIRRDILGQPLSRAAGVKPGLSSGHAFVEDSPAYAASMNCIVAARAALDSAHRFAAVLPSALQARDRPSLEPVVGATRVGDPPYDSWARPAS